MKKTALQLATEARKLSRVHMLLDFKAGNSVPFVYVIIIII